MREGPIFVNLVIRLCFNFLSMIHVVGNEGSPRLYSVLDFVEY